MISRRSIDNLFQWKIEETPEEETYPGENEDLKKIRDSKISDLLGIYKDEETGDKKERKELKRMREELKSIFRVNNPHYR